MLQNIMKDPLKTFINELKLVPSQNYDTDGQLGDRPYSEELEQADEAAGRVRKHRNKLSQCE